MNESDSTPTERGIPIPAARKPYTPPQMVEYGDLEALTKGGGSDGLDGQAGSSTPI